MIVLLLQELKLEAKQFMASLYSIRFAHIARQREMEMRKIEVGNDSKAKEDAEIHRRKQSDMESGCAYAKQWEKEKPESSVSTLKPAALKIAKLFFDLKQSEGEKHPHGFKESDDAMVKEFEEKVAIVLGDLMEIVAKLATAEGDVALVETFFSNCF